MKKSVLSIVLLLVFVRFGYALDLEYIFNETQRSILKTSADIVQASAGYDEIQQIVYITFWSNQPADSKKADAFNAYIAGEYASNSKDIIYIYERLLRSAYMLEYMATIAKSNKKWKFYYYYTDTLLPDTQRYCQLLKNAIVKIDPSYAAVIDERATRIKAFAIDLVNYQEALYGGGF
ncbi:MAG: hypothetical protein N3F66_02630 [Spirochaetes bacterium]|nr:hypothetical protein [Spirochaetota bacterium]